MSSAATRVNLDSRTSWQGRHIYHYDGTRDIHKLGAGDSRYFHNILPPHTNPDAIMADLLTEVELVQMFNITKHAEAVPLPRFVAAQADAVDAAHYRMPGCNQGNIPKGPWTPTVLRIKDWVQEAAGLKGLNHCVINLYPDENGSLAPHHDNTLDLVPGTGVASVSFGAVRPIHFHSVHTNLKVDINLQQGSLLCIGGKTNSQFTHGIHKLVEPCGPRISLTFRAITTTTDAEGNVCGSVHPGEDYPFRPSHRGERYPGMDEHEEAAEKRIEAMAAMFRAKAQAAATAKSSDLLLPPLSEDDDDVDDDDDDDSLPELEPELEPDMEPEPKTNLVEPDHGACAV
jgi:alkylated DNA repair dioxygenase AlkB